MDPADDQAMNSRLSVRQQKMHGTQGCYGEHVELTADISQIADVGNQKLRRLAHSSQRGTLVLGAEDNDGLSQQDCTALVEE